MGSTLLPTMRRLLPLLAVAAAEYDGACDGQAFAQTAMTIAPGAWQPKFDHIDSLEKMQDVRADVGVQWLLLTRTMEASRKVVEIIRKLEELVGQVCPLDLCCTI